VTFDWMPIQFFTFRIEYNHRHANVNYFAGQGGVTPPGGNTGSPGSPVPDWSPDLRPTADRMTAAIPLKSWVRGNRGCPGTGAAREPSRTRRHLPAIEAECVRLLLEGGLHGDGDPERCGDGAAALRALGRLLELRGADSRHPAL